MTYMTLYIMTYNDLIYYDLYNIYMTYILYKFNNLADIRLGLYRVDFSGSSLANGVTMGLRAKC